jgi:hypothetical protein
MKPATNPVYTPEEQAAHVAVVKAASEKANASMKPALDLYRERCWLWHLSCELPYRDLERLNGILKRLTHDDLKRVAAFAEGLAEWSEPASESPDAQITVR